MERLIHGTGLFPGCCCGLLHPHCSHQSADISDPAKMHRHNTKAVILSTQCLLIFVLEVTKLSYFIFLFQIPPPPIFSHKCCHHLYFLAQPSWNGTHRIVGYQRQRRIHLCCLQKINQMKVHYIFFCYQQFLFLFFSHTTEYPK